MASPLPIFPWLNRLAPMHMPQNLGIGARLFGAGEGDPDLTPGDVSNARTDALLSLGGSLLDAGGPRYVGQAPRPSLGSAIVHGLEGAVATGREAISNARTAHAAQTARTKKMDMDASVERVRAKYGDLGSKSHADLATILPQMASDYLSIGATDQADAVGKLADQFKIGARVPGAGLTPLLMANPYPSQGTRDEQIGWYQKLIPLALQSGEVEGANALRSALDSGYGVHTADAGGRTDLITPFGDTVRSIDKTLGPQALQMHSFGGFDAPFDPATGKVNLSGKVNRTSPPETFAQINAAEALANGKRNTEVDRQVRDFRTNTADVRNAATFYGQAKANLKLARETKDPSAIFPLLQQVIKVSDPNRVTAQEATDIQKMTGGTMDQVKNWLSMAAKGKPTAEFLNRLERSVDASAGSNRAKANTYKSNALKALKTQFPDIGDDYLNYKFVNPYDEIGAPAAMPPVRKTNSLIDSARAYLGRGG